MLVIVLGIVSYEAKARVALGLTIPKIVEKYTTLCGSRNEPS